MIILHHVLGSIHNNLLITAKCWDNENVMMKTDTYIIIGSSVNEMCMQEKVKRHKTSLLLNCPLLFLPFKYILSGRCFKMKESKKPLCQKNGILSLQNNYYITKAYVFRSLHMRSRSRHPGWVEAQLVHGLTVWPPPPPPPLSQHAALVCQNCYFY